MYNVIYPVLLVLILFLLPSLAWGEEGYKNLEAGLEPYIQQVDGGKGTINWTEGRIYAVGSSRIPENIHQDQELSLKIAEREALLQARKKLREILLDIEVNPAGNLRNTIRENPQAQEGFRTLVQHSLVWDTVYYHHPRNNVEVHVYLDLWDKSIRSLLPDRVFVSWDQGRDGLPVRHILRGCRIYLDARESGLKPVLVPVILDDEGNILFRASILGPEPRESQSRVGYTRVDKEGQVTRRYELGPQGFSIEAQDSQDSTGNKIVLSQEESERLQEFLEQYSVQECPILIIMNDDQ